ncbi:MAG TPA: hypothetical protein P5560_07045 [Thermotogota bacterium]|nr:hypothetical protein [Thermotogota bacterium]
MNEKKLETGWNLVVHPFEVAGEVLTAAPGTEQSKPWPYHQVPVDIPGTVVGGLAQNGLVEDPYFDQNMARMKGFKDARRGVYSNLPKPIDSPYRKSWWFSRALFLAEKTPEKHFWLQFHGIMDRANVWLNGKRIAGENVLRGAYRRYEVEVTAALREGENRLGVEVFSPGVDDFAVTFIDWNPVPPDDCMGIWQPVVLAESGQVRMRHPFVRTLLDDACTSAQILMEVELENSAREGVQVALKGEISPLSSPGAGVSFSFPVDLGAGEKRFVRIGPDQFPELRLENPKLWWPYDWGNPELYELSVDLLQDGKRCDHLCRPFGIRQVSSFLNDEGSLVLRVNGKELLVRGAAWTPDLLLRHDPLQDEIDVQMAKNMHFNAIRMEGKLGSDTIWEICDREGMLVLAGWDCCGFWEKWNDWKPGDLEIASQSLRSQLLRLRSHPSLALWFYGSDFPPPARVEREYLRVLDEVAPGLVRVSSAAHKAAELTGMPGVKMTGPYSYVPPNYWYDPQMEGHASGFNTETGPDVCLPVLESVKKMLQPHSARVGSVAWDFHAGLNDFANTHQVEKAIEERYGAPQGLEDTLMSSHLLGYECWRAMYEAHLRNWPKATGVIGWMMNSSWPSLIWQLYDVYNMPNGAFFGSQKGCTPVHAFFAYDDTGIYLSNTTRKPARDLHLRLRFFAPSGEKKWDLNMEQLAVAEFGVLAVSSLPESLRNQKGFLFLDLSSKGQLLDRNVYWLSFPQDSFADFDPKEWYHRPVKKPADLRWLRTLPPAAIKGVSSLETKGSDAVLKATLHNDSENIAFFLLAQLQLGDGSPVAPVFWQNNGLSVLPGEKMPLHACIPGRFLEECGKQPLFLQVRGWNATTRLPLGP